MVSSETLERLEKARAMKMGCPWEIPEYQPGSSGGPQAIMKWSGDAWDAARAYLDVIKAIENAVDKLSHEVAISENVGARGTAEALRQTRDSLVAVLPQ